MELKEGTMLFRYDLQKPPKNWDYNYRSNEYSHLKIDGFQKNHIGFYFFFDNEVVMHNTAKVACEKSSVNSFYMTHAELTRELKLLDLTGCSNPLLMIQKLIDVGIDILNDSYHIFCSIGTQSFSIIKDAVNYNLGIGIVSWERDVDMIQENTTEIQ